MSKIKISSSNNSVEIFMPKNINSENASYSFLSKLSALLEDTEYENIFLNFFQTRFFSSNQFAVLGCILERFLNIHPNGHIHLSHLSNDLLELINKNGFGVHFGFTLAPDIYNTIILYKVFDVNDLESYELYLVQKIFNRKEFSFVNVAFKISLQDYLLEVFKNAKDHTSSKNVYTCGQYFPKNSLLYFTIVDSGETIPYNVKKYFSLSSYPLPHNVLEWSLQKGTSTANKNGPRGIGLYLIKDFIKLNMGRLYIVSGSEMYEIVNGLERYIKLRYPFHGTIVTLAFNLKHSSCRETVEIQF